MAIRRHWSKRMQCMKLRPLACSGGLGGGFGDVDVPRGTFLDSPLKLCARRLSADDGGDDGDQDDGSPSIFDDLIAWGAALLLPISHCVSL